MGLSLMGAVAYVQAKPLTYDIDVPGMHASINFKVNHLGYSWLLGRFDKFEGYFIEDGQNPANEKVEVKIDTRSINSNHAERDTHLRSDDFLNTEAHPQARFVSTRIANEADGLKRIEGEFTLNGVTKPMVIMARKVGEGQDPWGGYRAGFEGSTRINMKDYGFKMDLGPASAQVYLDLHIEGVRRDELK
ncbi:MAG: YceI family protein [Thiomicrospira sp.]